MTIPTQQQDTVPTVWVLVDDRPGNTTQSIGLAHALGWPYEVKPLAFSKTSKWVKRWYIPFAATTVGLDAAHSAPLAPPWPDVVIAAGWRPAPVARWIRRQSDKPTYLIHLGRKGGHVARLFDIVVTCGYFHLPPHPRRIELIAPLTQITAERLTQAAAQWQHLFANAPRPYVVLLVGGAAKQHEWTPEIARRLGADVRAAAQSSIGGSVFALTSRRTGDDAAVALTEGLGESACVHRWQPGQKENPYLGYLALADVLIVTGESESMLAEAAAVGKPLFIYPLPQHEIPSPRLKKRLKLWLKRWTVEHAYPKREDTNFSTRSAKALVAKLLIASGLVRPRRDLHELHQALIRRGVAWMFGEPLRIGNQPPLREIDRVAQQVREMLRR